ncbi:transposase [Mycolicibacterium komossense]|uniref:Transposase n=1 Tax=Mycolicibacterium komossense TaxID=1779 RepID=A0ABT3CJA4_9MYCO|nr:transposase [Mycolicibacterium komossense]
MFGGSSTAGSGSGGPPEGEIAGASEVSAPCRGSPFLSGPLRTVDDVEYATMEWVDWFNNRRLHSLLDYIPPEEYETAYSAQLRTSQPAMSQT